MLKQLISVPTLIACMLFSTANIQAASSTAASVNNPSTVTHEDYPNHSLRLIVGFPSGGATDLVARTIAPKLSELLKQSVIIDNRPGANGTLAAGLTAEASPDGYTLHLATLGAMVISPTITKLPYDPLKDFAPIGLAVRLQNIFVTHPRLAAHTIPELITLLRQTPNLNYASSGLGSPGHLAGALFQTMTKTELNHIPYKGGGLALADLAGGQIPLFIAVISTSLPLIKAGKVNAIAVTGPKRTPVLPEVPTVSETNGLKQYEASNWYGLVSSANTPKPIIDRLQASLQTVIYMPEVRDALLARGIDPAPSTPEEFVSYLKAETNKWQKVVKFANLKQ